MRRAAALAAAALVVLVVACGGRPPESPRPAHKLTREEFKNTVQGKTPKQVLAALGRPDRTEQANSDDHARPDYSARWIYYDLTLDPVSGKTDATAYVDFFEGKASRPSF